MDASNNVQLIGHLGQDPEERRTESGRMVVQFSMATNEGWKDQHGEWQSRTHWHKIVVWGNFGELLARKLRKGDKVLIGGMLKYNSYEDKNGSQQVRAYVEAKTYVDLSGRRNSEPLPEEPPVVGPRTAAPDNKNNDAPATGADDDLPF